MQSPRRDWRGVPGEWAVPDTVIDEQDLACQNTRGNAREREQCASRLRRVLPKMSDPQVSASQTRPVCQRVGHQLVIH